MCHNLLQGCKLVSRGSLLSVSPPPHPLKILGPPRTAPAPAQRHRQSDVETGLQMSPHKFHHHPCFLTHLFPSRWQVSGWQQAPDEQSPPRTTHAGPRPSLGPAAVLTLGLGLPLRCGLWLWLFVALALLSSVTSSVLHRPYATHPLLSLLSSETRWQTE